MDRPATAGNLRARWNRWLKRLRGYEKLKPLTSKDLAGRWLRQYARAMVLQNDALGFLFGGLIAGLLAYYFSQVERDGEAALVGLTLVGFAALAVVLTALTIFVTFVDSTYLDVLNMHSKGGTSGYIVPYLSAALVSTATTTFGAIGLLAYDAVHPAAGKAAILGIEVGLVVWTALSVFQLIVEIAMHGLNRYELAAKFGSRQIPEFDEILRMSNDDTPPAAGPDSASSMGSP